MINWFTLFHYLLLEYDIYDVKRRSNVGLIHGIRSSPNIFFIHVDKYLYKKGYESGVI